MVFLVFLQAVKGMAPPELPKAATRRLRLCGSLFLKAQVWVDEQSHGNEERRCLTQGQKRGAAEKQSGGHPFRRRLLVATQRCLANQPPRRKNQHRNGAHGAHECFINQATHHGTQDEMAKVLPTSMNNGTSLWMLALS